MGVIPAKRMILMEAKFQFSDVKILFALSSATLKKR